MTIPLEWSFNPWRDRPGGAVAAGACGAFACVAVASLDLPPLVTLGLGIAIVGSLSPLLSPARCRVDDGGVWRRRTFVIERRAWSEIKRCVPRAAGLLVSPYPIPHWLDRYRSLLLPIPRRQRDRVMADLREQLARHGF